MTLSQEIRAAQGGPIRLATEPETVLQVIDGQFFTKLGDGDIPYDNRFSLNLQQIESDQWEYEKKTWEGKAPRAKTVEVK